MRRLILAACLATFTHATHALDAVRPNILFAIADDWGPHAGIYGTRWVKTPAFDRISREGLLYQNACKAQGEPRMNGHGYIFDRYKPTEGDGLYESFLRGEAIKTVWINPTDFEKEPIKP